FLILPLGTERNHLNSPTPYSLLPSQYYHQKKRGFESTGLSKKPYGGSSSSRSPKPKPLPLPLLLSAAFNATVFQFGGVTPSRCRTKKSLRMRVPSGPVAPWPPFGVTS